MRTWILGACLFGACLAALGQDRFLQAEEVAAADELQSGIPIGERADEFLVKDCTGPAAGKTLCYFCRYGIRPVVCVFSKSPPAEIGDLVAGVDKLVGAHRDASAAGFVVSLGSDTAEAEQGWRSLAQERRIVRVPLTIYKDRRDRLRDIFQISPDASLTILVWRRGVVCENVALSSPPGEQLEQLLARVEKALTAE
ncbi:hypothetical protein [Lignipirellula cremea]|uniref:AhpC/TSA family protein n=1 Tax=Lignipirellula cremea TaxID=2528010 RepID=A0A518DNL6_9BACT|nr:hypothetical protein [Lignipirellula cremea]QDU93426.1 hypothetical protein Pla8534_12060 [Lignipirellula cremea]